MLKQPNSRVALPLRNCETFVNYLTSLVQPFQMEKKKICCFILWGKKRKVNRCEERFLPNMLFRSKPSSFTWKYCMNAIEGVVAGSIMFLQRCPCPNPPNLMTCKYVTLNSSRALRMWLSKGLWKMGDYLGLSRWAQQNHTGIVSEAEAMQWEIGSRQQSRRVHAHLLPWQH